MRGKSLVDEDRIKETVTDFLVHFPFFNQLDSKDLAIVAQHIGFTEIEKGSTLFKEGDNGDCMYFVVDGELDVIKESVSGSKTGIDRVVIATLYRGCSIGEMSIIDNVPRSATVKARSNATMVTLTQEGFGEIVEDHPKIGVKILVGLSRLLSRNLRKTSGRLADYTLTWSKMLEDAQKAESEYNSP